MNAIEVKQISKSYGRVKALQDVSFAVEKGGCMSVCRAKSAGSESVSQLR